jgi:hypothetical protein
MPVLEVVQQVVKVEVYVRLLIIVENQILVIIARDLVGEVVVIVVDLVVIVIIVVIVA